MVLRTQWYWEVSCTYLLCPVPAISQAVFSLLASAILEHRTNILSSTRRVSERPHRVRVSCNHACPFLTRNSSWSAPTDQLPLAPNSVLFLRLRQDKQLHREPVRRHNTTYFFLIRGSLYNHGRCHTQL
jgi:hypothetical protein